MISPKILDLTTVKCTLNFTRDGVEDSCIHDNIHLRFGIYMKKSTRQVEHTKELGFKILLAQTINESKQFLNETTYQVAIFNEIIAHWE